jgi:putative redox protein
MSDQVQASISETGASAFAVRIETGGHVIIGDEPPAAGGGDLGPAPYQLLAAALGECTAMTVRWYARQKNWPLEHVAVEITYEKGVVENRPGKTDIFHKTVHLRGDLTPEQHRILIDVAGKCPVHRTLQSMPAITTIDGGVVAAA